MGLLRVLLAFLVVVHHIPGFLEGNPSFPVLLRRLDGMVCVLIFYIFSGFYMSLVINEKYSKALRFPLSFYVSRALRIFPLYWTILLLFYFYDATSGHPGRLAALNALDWPAWLAQVFMNITTFGLDWVPSLGGYTLQLNAPAWSLGTELSFYVLAPWLVRLTWRRSLALVCLIFAIRFFLLHLGYGRYPLRVLFFPLSLGFFMLGHLAYLLMGHLKRAGWAAAVSKAKRPLGVMAVGGILAADLLLDAGGGIDPDTANLWVFYVIVTLLIPIAFIGVADSPIDRFLGDLSFPLYISHALVLTFVADYVGGGQSEKAFIAIGLAVSFAVLLTLAIEQPIERVRAKIVTFLMRTRLHVTWPTLILTRPLPDVRERGQP